MARRNSQYSVIILLTQLLSLVLFASNTFAYGPPTLDFSLAPTGPGMQRKIFYDAPTGHYWRFLQNHEASGIMSQYSADGENWTSSTTVTTAFNRFSMRYAEVAGTGYIFVTHSISDDIFISRVTIGATTLAISTAEKVFDGNSPYPSYNTPTLAIDSNDILWLAATEITNYGTRIVSRTLDGSLTGSLASWDPKLYVSPLHGGITDIALEKSIDGEMVLIAGLYSESILSWHFNGVTWEDKNDSTYRNWIQRNTPAFGVGKQINTIVEDGSGGFYFGGNFGRMGGIEGAKNILHWDGTQTTSLLAGLNGEVNVLFREGANLYVGGKFTNAGGAAGADYLARWDGNTWHAVAAGLNGRVTDILRFSGALYITGEFLDVDGDTAKDTVLRLNGSSWESTDFNASGVGNTLCEYGGQLYVGLNNAAIYRGDGSSWGLFAQMTAGGSVEDLLANGADLYVGGNFSDADSTPVSSGIARWDGANWNSLGTGVSGSADNAVANPAVFSMQYIAGSLYAAGNYVNAGAANSVSGFARWNGAVWSDGDGNAADPGAIRAFASFGAGYIFGGYSSDGQYIDASSKYSLFNDKKSFNAPIHSVVLNGNGYYLGGEFTDAFGDPLADHIVYFNGVDAWESLDGGLNGNVTAMKMIGGNLYVGGPFTNAGGNPNADGVAIWDGSNWQAIGTGLSVTAVHAFEEYGGELYIAGSFTNGAGIGAADNIIRWNGSAWNAVGIGLGNTVRALKSFGGQLYAGGEFDNAAGIAAADRIARWNGSNWSALPGGWTPNVFTYIYSMEEFQSELYIGGYFSDAAGDPNADNLVVFNGSNFHSLNNTAFGFGPALYGQKTVSDRLYLTGSFFAVGPDAASTNAYWNGSRISEMYLDFGGSSSPKSIDATDDKVVSVGFYDGTAPAQVNHLLEYVNTTLIGTNFFSSLTDPDGNIHLVAWHDLNNDRCTYRRFDAQSKTWLAPVKKFIKCETPNISYNRATGDIHILSAWEDGLVHSILSSPYDEAHWSAVTTLDASDNRYVASSEYDQNGRIVYMTSGSHSAPFPINNGALDVTLTISGNISDSGSPLSGVSIDAGPLGSTATDASGNYQLSGIAYGTNYTLTPTLAGYSFSSVSGTASSDTTVDFQATLLTYNLAGQLLSGTTPLAGVNISSPELGTTTSDNSGHFSFSNVPHFTNYTLHFSKEFYDFSPPTISGTITGPVNLNVAATKNSFDVSGRVTLENLTETPLAGVTIRAGNRSTVTNSGGQYTFSNLYRGPYTLTAELDGYLFNPENGTEITVSNQALGNNDFSAIPATANPAYAMWNGFLGMINILEILNTSTTPLNLSLTLYSIGGENNTINQTWTIPPLTQRDIIINDLPGFSPNTYGMLKIVTSHNRFDGRVTLYYPEHSGNSAATYGFAYSDTLRPANQGPSATTFNTYHPGTYIFDRDNNVYNWLTLANLEESSNAHFTVRRYDMDGNLVIEQRVTVPPLGRRDIDGGHINPGPGNVGTNIITPDNNNQKYLATLVRYAEGSNFNDFDYAISQPATRGSRENIYAPISSNTGLENYLEIANVLSEPVGVALAFFDDAGLIISEETFSLPALGQRHFAVTNLSQIPTNGYVKIRPSKTNAIVGQSVFYKRNNSRGSIETAWASAAREPFGRYLHTSYNLYLNMLNFVQISNITANELTTATTFNIPAASGPATPLSSSDILPADASYTWYPAASSLADSENTYGIVQFESSKAGALLGEIVRLRRQENGEYEFAIPTLAR
ncbi:MAG: carboxypeptidase regulatory-like domain-containing protein [bacterium]|nr:carboxypeptidase regulatory-like domain-containing protein [bacterium]